MPSGKEMRSPWNIALLLGCAALICGVSISWQVYRAKANEVKLAQEARVCRASAEKGDPRAQAEFGRMYSHGQGVPQDYTEAVLWYRKAAEQGDPNGEDGLGFMYYRGQGVPQDYSKAAYWYREAADQGDAKGEDGLALMYFRGKGVPQNYAEALRWLRKAVDQDYAKAQYDLGYMYYTGNGVRQDPAEAVRWFQKASDQGDEDAVAALSEEFTLLAKLVLLGQFLLGIWLSLDFFSFKSLAPRKSLRDFQQKVTTGTGILCIFCAAVYWYGYAHHEIRCLQCGLTGFALFRWFLDAALIALLVYIVRSGKRPEAEQHGGESSKADAGSERET
jgi:Sel1 repeat